MSDATLERIQKILARGGIASRRAAEALITSGRVRVNGQIVTELGAKADARRDRVEVDGKRVVAETFAYVVLNKPRGVVSTMSDPEGRPSVRELLADVGVRVYPVGRLDFATSGVLLATNDGAFADALLHPRRAVPKTYVVKVHGKMEAGDLDRWRTGVHLEDGVTMPAELKLLRHEGDKTWFELTIREGRNQQIRRMGEATRFPVMRLSRVGFANVLGEGLRPGQWRHLSRDELVTLKKEFGVPRRLPPRPAAGAPEVSKRSLPAPRRGAAGRTARARGEARSGPSESATPEAVRRAGRSSGREAVKPPSFAREGRGEPTRAPRGRARDGGPARPSADRSPRPEPRRRTDPRGAGGAPRAEGDRAQSAAAPKKRRH